jgi:hypothetical protein
LLLACIAAPSAGLHAAARDVELGSAPAPQDTTKAKPTKPTRPELRRRRPAVPDSLRRAFPDSLFADSLFADSLMDRGEPFPDPDSIMLLLMQLPGYRTVVYQGDTIQFSTQDRAIHIRERANIERAGERLTADSVVYQGEKGYITAYGKAKLINAEGEEVDSEEGPLYYHTGRGIGTMIGGRTKWEIWNVAGNFTLEGSDTLWVSGGHFTSCDLPEPHYRFESDRIKLVLGHIVVAWPVRLYFGDVPVFWFPFIAQDIRRDRHSGILAFRFGVNDVVRNSPSHRRHVSNLGYYWAISDYMDAQLSLDWWSQTWTRVDGFYRYRWRERFLNGRVGYSHFFLPEGGRELSFSWNHSQRFGERADLRAAVQFVSSQQFQRENEFNPERLVQQIRSDIGFTRRFDWGTLNLAGQRVQPLSNPESGPTQPTTTTLPQFSLTLSPIVLTPARSPLDARWYNGLTWTGSTNLSRQTSESPSQPNRTSLNTAGTSNLALGNLRWSSSGSYREDVTDKPDTLFTAPDTTIIGADTTITVDTLVLAPEVKEGRLNWRTSVGYQQRLIGSTTLTPAVNLDGSLFRSNETGLGFVTAPTRMSVSANLNTDVYGFFPGVGPLERVRHKFSPGFSWSYSPEVQPSPELVALRSFSTSEVAEQHRLTLTLSQTFEGKLKPREEADSISADTAQARRPQESRKLTLLAIRTSALTYDIVEKELTTDRISNSITSDLIRGLTLRVDHDLFEELSEGDRRFDPFLSQLNLTFSLGDRTLAGLFGEPSSGVSRGRGIVPEAQPFDLEDEQPPEEEEEQRPGSRGRRTPWNISLDYSLVRQRPVEGQDPRPTRQSVRGNLRFQPTQNWTLTWRTQYDLEENEFVDHALSLRRDLHRWAATFEFFRASNGNFLFEFRVNLTDLQDVKFDYRQETRR